MAQLRIAGLMQFAAEPILIEGRIRLPPSTQRGKRNGRKPDWLLHFGGWGADKLPNYITAPSCDKSVLESL